MLDSLDRPSPPSSACGLTASTTSSPPPTRPRPKGSSLRASPPADQRVQCRQLGGRRGRPPRGRSTASAGLTFAAMSHLDEVVTAGGIVLRSGTFYGPGDEALVKPIRRGWTPLFGDGHGGMSLTDLDEAAAATVVALEHDNPGIHNVVVDDPPRGWLPELARIVRAKPPRHIPAPITRLVAGAGFMECRGSPNARAKRELVEAQVREVARRSRRHAACQSQHPTFRLVIGQAPLRRIAASSNKHLAVPSTVPRPARRAPASHPMMRFAVAGPVRPGMNRVLRRVARRASFARRSASSRSDQAALPPRGPPARWISPSWLGARGSRCPMRPRRRDRSRSRSPRSCRR